MMSVEFSRRAVAHAVCLALALCAGLACTRKPPAIQWDRAFGNEDTFCEFVVQTTDGGYCGAGVVRQASLGNSDVFVQKWDSLGGRVWCRSYGGPASDWALSLQQTRDGGFVVCGSGADSTEAILFKLDSVGNTEWTFDRYVSSAATSVAQARDGGYVVAGIFGPDDRPTLLKLDSLGSVLWRRDLPDTFTRNWTDIIVPVRQTLDGGYIVGAQSLIKTDSLGNVAWQHRYGNVQIIYSVQQTKDSGFVATGIGTPAQLPWEQTNILLLKTDAQGHMRWRRTYRITRESIGRSVWQTRDGGYFVCGEDGPAYVFATDAHGNLRWGRTIDVGFRWARSGQQTRDGGYIVAVHHHLVKLAPEQSK